MAMLLKSLSKDIPNFENLYMELPHTSGVVEVDKVITIDEFLEMFPNRVEALNKYMRLDLNG